MKLRKLFSILCAVALVVSAMSVMAFAASDDFGGENLYYAVKVPEGQTITPDGVLDEAYANTQVIPIVTKLWGDLEQPTEATVRVMWDENYLYIFTDVTDSTRFGFDGGIDPTWYDCVETFIDLLHDDGKASADWNGGWGGGYRGDVMCEARYKICGGISDQFPDQIFGGGSEAVWDMWWSCATKDDAAQETKVVSKLTDTGYTVEFKIKANFNEIPADLRLHDGQEIGFGVKLYDKNNAEGKDTTIVVMEGINDGMHTGPKALSDLKLVNSLPVENETPSTPAVDTVVEIFSGSHEITSKWNWDGMPLNVSEIGFNASVIAEGGHFSITYTGTAADAVYMVVVDDDSWVEGSENHYVQLDNAESCVANADGSYTSTFSYAQLAGANTEKNLDFTAIDFIRIGQNNNGDDGITVTNVSWVMPGSAETGDTSLIVIASAAVLVSVIGMVAIVSKRRFAV